MINKTLLLISVMIGSYSALSEPIYEGSKHDAIDEGSFYSHQSICFHGELFTLASTNNSLDYLTIKSGQNGVFAFNDTLAKRGLYGGSGFTGTLQVCNQNKSVVVVNDALVFIEFERNEPVLRSILEIDNGSLLTRKNVAFNYPYLIISFNRESETYLLNLEDKSKYRIEIKQKPQREELEEVELVTFVAEGELYLNAYGRLFKLNLQKNSWEQLNLNFDEISVLYTDFDRVLAIAKNSGKEYSIKFENGIWKKLTTNGVDFQKIREDFRSGFQVSDNIYMVLKDIHSEYITKDEFVDNIKYLLELKDGSLNVIRNPELNKIPFTGLSQASKNYISNGGEWLSGMTFLGAYKAGSEWIWFYNSMSYFEIYK